jgi:hypothetical protein
VLATTSTIASSGAGAIDLVISNSPAGCPGWSNFVAIFDEYRVLGFEVQFVPYNQYSKSTQVTSSLVGVIDRDNAAALTSYNGAVQSSSYSILSLENPWTKTARLMGTTEEGQFFQTSSPTSNVWIKLYADSLSLSSTYGRYFVTFRVQFRGKGV